MSAKSHTPGSDYESGGSEPFELSRLQRDCERFRLLVENSHDIIVEVTPEREVLYVSPNCEAVLGFAPSELIGSDVIARVHPADLADVQKQFASHSGRAVCRHRHKDGSWRWFETTSREFTAANGETRRVLVARDITAEREAAAERERFKVELARAEKLTALGTLAGGMAHDFNNLLTAIHIYADLALGRTTDPTSHGALEQIMVATKRAKNIAQQVLDFSRGTDLARSPVGVAAIAREVLQLLRPTIPAQIEIVSELPEHDDVVLGNATQLHQVLINLCHNAVHAMRDQPGRLEVRVSRVEVEAAFARGYRGMVAGPHVCLTVTDNGHGMDAATLRRIFEPFFTTKPSGYGSGLGLAVVQRIVRDHEGVIDVTTREGEGTTFQVFFRSLDTPMSCEPTAVTNAA